MTKPDIAYDATSVPDMAGCPECAAPAVVVDRFVLRSTDGPIEHVTVRCARGHWFRAMAESVPGAAAPPGQSRTG